MSTAKISKVNSHQPNEWNGKYFHEFLCDGIVDGNASTFVVSIFSPSKDKPDLPIGQDIEVEYDKDYKGTKKYKYRKPRAGGGGSGGAPKNEKAIAAQVSLKCAVRYAETHLPDCAPEDVMDVANRFLRWIKENS